MDIMGLLGIGAQITVLGMGLVFLLLAVMALLIVVLLRLDKGEPVAEKRQEPASILPAGLDADTIAAIMIAVAKHRAVRRKAAAPMMRTHRPGSIPSNWVTVGRGLQNTSWHPGRRNP